MKKITNLLVIAGLFILASCAKEGCTDPNSLNYDPDAKKSDGSCKFESKITFWYGQTTAGNLVSDGVTSLTYYVDNNLVGSSAASVYYTGAPECGQSSTIGVTKDLGSNTSKTVTYKVLDQDDQIVWEGTKTLNANTCLALELTY